MFVKEKFQKVLPASTMGISLILHLLIFMGIGGIIIVDRVDQKQPFTAVDNMPSTPMDIPPVPDEPQQEPMPDSPTHDASDAPSAPALQIEQIASSAPATMPTMMVQAPVVSISSGNATSMGGGKGAGSGAGAPKGPRVQTNPFGVTASDDPALLVGYMYDLKKGPDGKPNKNMWGDPKADMNTPVEQAANREYHRTVAEFVEKKWDMSMLERNYYKFPKPLGAYQIFIPELKSDEAPKAFGAQNEILGKRWLIVYKGRFTSPVKGTFRFVGSCDDIIAARLNGKTVMDGSISSVSKGVAREEGLGKTVSGYVCQLKAGDWFQLEEGQSYSLDVMIGEEPGGWYHAYLFIQEKGKSYQQRPGNAGPIFPVFQTAPVNRPKTYDAEKTAPTVAKESFICQ